MGRGCQIIPVLAIVARSKAVLSRLGGAAKPGGARCRMQCDPNRLAGRSRGKRGGEIVFELRRRGDLRRLDANDQQ